MTAVDTADLLSVSDASRMGVSALIHRAEMGQEPVILRNNKPVAAVVSIERLDRMQQMEEDTADIALVLARLITTSSRRTDLDDVLVQLGYTREQIDAVED